LVEDHLDEALILAERNRLPIAHKGEATDTDLAAALFRPGLGEADRGDLRIAVSAAWDEVLVEGMRVQPLDRLDTDHALVLGLVREHRRTRDITDGVDAGDAGLAETINDDCAAVGLHRKLFQSEILDIPDHADGGNDPLEFGNLGLALGVVYGGDDAV